MARKARKKTECVRCSNVRECSYYAIPEVLGASCNPCYLKWKMTADPNFRERRLRSKKAYYEANKEVLLRKQHEYEVKNKELILARERTLYHKNIEMHRTKDRARYVKNRERKLEINRLSRIRNKDKIYARNRRYNKHRYQTNLNFRIASTLRARFGRACRDGTRKYTSAVRDLGCTIGELKKYLENQFVPGMTWDSYGLKGWHIDHIRPISSFDLTDPDQQRAACHYTNLQPLWAVDNLKKSNKTLEGVYKNE